MQTTTAEFFLPRIRKLPFAGIPVLLLLLGLVAGFSGSVGAVEYRNVAISLLDYTSKKGIAGKQVIAWKLLSNGNEVWQAQGTTDRNGKLVLKLAGLGSGARFVLKSNPFGNGWVKSRIIRTPGPFTFWGGAVNAKLVQGRDGSVLRDYKTTLYEIVNGKRVWRAVGTTASNGVVRLDPAGIFNRNRVFVLSAVNPFDGSTRFSQKIRGPGRVNFKVGNRLLVVRLINPYTRQTQTGKSIYVYRKTGPAKWTRVTTGVSDSSGRALFDLEGLGSGAVYVLQSNPYRTGMATSPVLKRPGRYDFKVGQVQVRLKKGSNGEFLSNHSVSLYQFTGGKWKKVISTTTNSNGFAWFDPAPLNGKSKFIFSAVSPFDNTVKISQPIRAAGRYLFTVGNKLLNVKLVNHHTGLGLKNKSIQIYRFAKGAWKDQGQKTTDDSGFLRLDLVGLGQGAAYRFAANPYGNWIQTPAIKRTGSYIFRAGKLQFSLRRGMDNSEMATHTVTLQERVGKELKWHASGKTDSEGRIWFDPPGLQHNKRVFTLTTENPFDGSTKFSRNVRKAGKYLFPVGNRLLNISLVNKLSGEGLADKKITAYRVEKSGSLSWVRSGTTSSSGRISFDLDGLGSTTAYVMSVNPYGFGNVSTPPVTTTGDLDFEVGTIEIEAIRGQDGSALANHKIALYERTGSGESQWHASGTTDSSGIVRLDPQNLDTSKKFFLVARNPFDAKTKYSKIFTGAGKQTFTVGNKLLSVNLKDAINGNPVGNRDVIIYEKLKDDSLKWVHRTSFDATGKIVVDLDGLGNGRVYVLKAHPYPSGWVKSRDIITTGSFDFPVGALSVTLKDGDSNQPLPGNVLTLYEKTPDGKRHWRAYGSSDAAGNVRFDPEFSRGNEVYVVHTHNVYGEKRHFYSNWIQSTGEIGFTVRNGEESDQDFVPPALQISSPANGSQVADAGFILSGISSDNDTIASITVNLSDPVHGNSSVAANYTNGFWSARVPGNRVSAGNSIAINVVAADPSHNTTTRGLTLKIIDDNTKPSLVIESHKNGDPVSDNGFLLSGTVSDDTGVDTLTASIDQPPHGRIADSIGLQISPSTGRWAFPYPAIPTNGPLTVIVKATDSAGNANTQSITLDLVPVTHGASHLLNRISFGVTPRLLKQVRQQGTAAYISDQIKPSATDTPELAGMLADIGNIDSDSLLQRYQLAHAMFSKWQLREVMTWFWENHFNTDLRKVSNINYELAENRKFRANALGNFRDILEISATSPAMMIYLDNHTSKKEEPNENYARELLELHTMGVNGRYSAEDIVQVARVFTGWRVEDSVFTFSPYRHDNGEKTVLGEIIPENSGFDGGLQVLDILATHPSTADFICAKLLKVFVTDDPSPTSISNCATTFLNHSDDASQIASVVESILTSADFYQPDNFHSKVKTPIEFLAGMIRNTDAVMSHKDSRRNMESLGMNLFHYPVPTGWPETGNKWVNSNQLFQRLVIANTLVHNKSVSYRSHIDDPAGYFMDRGFETSDGVIGFLFDTLLANDYSQEEWDEAAATLSGGSGIPFNIRDEDANERLRTLFSLVLNYPSYQLQ